jgi:DNA modification methylase
MQLICGDCLEIMKTLPAGSVDAVITDPPYLIRAGHGGGVFGERAHLVNTGGFTDAGCDFGFLKEFGNWFCFCSRRQLKELIVIAERCDRWNLITWAKPNPVPTCNNKYLPDVEYIVHGFGRSKLFGEYKDKQSFFIWPCGDKETIHPNEKPIALMIKLIRLGTRPGDIVLDPFMGSGTTGVACIETGRDFIGIEIDPGYFAIAEKRIKDAQAQLLLNF